MNEGYSAWMSLHIAFSTEGVICEKVCSQNLVYNGGSVCCPGMLTRHKQDLLRPTECTMLVMVRYADQFLLKID